MGMRRGSFEGVSLSSQVERTVEHSAIRPDEGTPLRIGAKALDSWADAFGKMANAASKMKAKGDANVATQATCRNMRNEAIDALDAYDTLPDNQKNPTQRAKLESAVEQATARYDASKTLGVFSYTLDMSRDYRRKADAKK